MASDTTTQSNVRAGTTLETWQAGLVGGIAGGIVMGIMLTMQMTPVIENAIPAMYGLEGALFGWAAHLFHSAVLGVVFGAVLAAAGRTNPSLGTGAGAGLAYGVVLWAVLAVIVMPVWLSAVGFGMAPDLPNVNMQSLVGHLAYGLVLGVVYALIE